MNHLPTWEEIEAAPLDVLTQLFWQPIPARNADERARVRRMAERMAELEPKTAPREYLPAPEKITSQEPQSPPPCPLKAKPKPKIKPASAVPDLDHFKSLFQR